MWDKGRQAREGGRHGGGVREQENIKEEGQERERRWRREAARVRC